ncbi:MAG: DUF1592 domain-containing protein [Cyclobacteriaceae bacterium]
MLKPASVFILFFFIQSVAFCDADDQALFQKSVQPILEQHCYSCHGHERSRAGINLEKYDDITRIYKDGQLWLRVHEIIASGEMPPKSEKPLSKEQYEVLVEGINQLLSSSINMKNPGRVAARRLSHLEYQYTIKDLLGVDFAAMEYFPTDGSGGGGFDNQARTLFMSPLKLERYYQASEIIVDELRADPALWEKVVPFEFEITIWQRISAWIKSMVISDYEPVKHEVVAARKVITPMASKFYRRYLKPEEIDVLSGLFETVYHSIDEQSETEKFNLAISQVLRAILVSPNFLYRLEQDSERKTPYEISDFELATRLSYFLWCSAPDEELLTLARNEQLQDSTVLAGQVLRMLADPKSERFMETFSIQWFGIQKLLGDEPVADPERYPELTAVLRKAMVDETVTYFSYVVKESRNFLELISGNYSFINETLADHYGISNVTGDHLRMVALDESNRGGLLGMGSILTVSSLPERTSPVLRGKWVLEQVLGTPPPPPPPGAGELEDDEAAHKEVGLRRLLEIHREKPECQSCHEKMDPIGLGLENFDAIGRWRTSYGEAPIDPSGVMDTGEAFSGPNELKTILADEKEKFARNLSMKMLSYALGRSVGFSDESTVRSLQTSLLENEFDSHGFLITLVTSYTFREKVNDKEIGKELL